LAVLQKGDGRFFKGRLLAFELKDAQLKYRVLILRTLSCSIDIWAFSARADAEHHSNFVLSAISSRSTAELKRLGIVLRIRAAVACILKSITDRICRSLRCRLCSNTRRGTSEKAQGFQRTNLWKSIKPGSPYSAYRLSFDAAAVVLENSIRGASCTQAAGEVGRAISRGAGWRPGDADRADREFRERPPARGLHHAPSSNQAW